MNQIAFRLRHDESFTDDSAALRNHRTNIDGARKPHPDQAAVIDLVVEHQAIRSNLLATTGEATNRLGTRISIVHNPQDVLNRCRKGIGEQQEGSVIDTGLWPSRKVKLILSR